MSGVCHLAQVNIGRMRGDIGEPVMAGFVARLDDINALAESSEGFVWRLKTEGNNATDLRPYPDALIILNLSVWESPAHLKQFVYRGAHAAVMKQRREWFHRFEQTYSALWWIPAGHEPTVAEAQERLKYLQRHGPTEFAFGFASLFPAPSARAAATQDQKQAREQN